MEPDLEEYCRESARSYDTVPDVYPEDFIFKFIMGHPSFSDPKDAVSYYFGDGRSSAHKVREILTNTLRLAPGTPLILLEFASGYGCVPRHLAKLLPNISILASDIHPEANEFVRE